jgi:MFS family permease
MSLLPPAVLVLLSNQQSAAGIAALPFPSCLPPPAAPLQHVAGDDPFCKFNDQMLQLFTSCLFLSGAAAAMVGSYTCRRFGRKATMIAGGACFLGGTVLVTLAIHMAMLVLGRLVLGVGVGFATQVGAGAPASCCCLLFGSAARRVAWVSCTAHQQALAGICVNQKLERTLVTSYHCAELP